MLRKWQHSELPQLAGVLESDASLLHTMTKKTRPAAETSSASTSPVLEEVTAEWNPSQKHKPLSKKESESTPSTYSRITLLLAKSSYGVAKPGVLW
jgi:hypothetical protein